MLKINNYTILNPSSQTCPLRVAPACQDLAMSGRKQGGRGLVGLSAKGRLPMVCGRNPQ